MKKNVATKITITEMCGGEKMHLQFYGPHAMYADGSVMPFNKQMAIVSHYLHNRTSSYENTFAEKAPGLIEDIYNVAYKAKGIDLVEEIAPEYSLFADLFAVPFLPVEKPKFTFIDLFAGIGGFRIAMQNLGGKCVFSSEWDEDAQKTYLTNFGEVPFGDITKQETKDFIPQGFDVLCAGFPCQAFSVAGYQKGFEDERGTLFFDIAKILEKHRPKAFFLENVKNLQSHDGGKTFRVIYDTLKDLGYEVFYKVMNSMAYANIPQNRERIFIIGFAPDLVERYREFTFPKKVKLTRTIHSCIDKGVEDEKYFYREDKYCYAELAKNMTDPNTVYQWRRHYVRENQSNVCPTLTANMGTGGHNVPLIITDKGLRKLTPKECLNFQGFPKKYTFPNISITKCYKQAGNSVTVPLIQAVAEKMISLL